MQNVLHHSLLTDFDSNLFKAGKHYKLYEKLGNHRLTVDGQDGVYFAVWAPNAASVAVIGSFNGWNPKSHMLASRWDGTGIWEGFIPGVQKGALYKYRVETRQGYFLEKGDPFACYWEMPPKTASIVWDTWYEWKDGDWMAQRQASAGQPKPYSVYEVHLGSWRKLHQAMNRSLNYGELKDTLVPYVKDMGFTHVEFMPVMEHPFYGSWGYQITGYFAPSSRYGTPQEFMELVDAFHQAGIGIILDWVPSHFPEDLHGLAQFDGTHLYEHADPRKGFHPDWKSLIFNYGRYEVRSFLISNALYWLDRFHADGLRVDAVASMLYLDYSRKAGEWIPNEYGGNENLEAISLLKEFNAAVKANFPDAITVAEESTAWPGVSRPIDTGGLGFDQKWMMGWMHDTLEFFKKDPIYRRFHQNNLSFGLVYAFSENFMLPLSHDEVVHGKGSLLQRMPGDNWQRYANLRALFGFMFTHPGTQLVFMGGEYGQDAEWSHDNGLYWDHAERPLGQGMMAWMKALNTFYKNSPALYELAFAPEGFEWIDYNDHARNIMVYARKGSHAADSVVVVGNFTPAPHSAYRIGLPGEGTWEVVLNSDDRAYGGSGFGSAQAIEAEAKPWHGRAHSAEIVIPPLAVMLLRRQAAE